jgi:hypothetical protein
MTRLHLQDSLARIEAILDPEEQGVSSERSA